MRVEAMTARAKGAKGRADDLFSQLIRSRGYCERCGSTEFLQCAHLITRARLNTRWMTTNAWCLCARCHIRLTHWPVEHRDFIWETRGKDAYDDLRRLSESTHKVWRKSDFEAEVVRLKALLEAAA
jgi:5-methylcytosine-specific restriction endonuclease McrA